MKKSYVLEDLDCASCANKIEKHVAKLEGVQSANVDFVQKKMQVEIDDVNVERAIIKVIKELEPEVLVKEIHDHVHCDCDSEAHITKTNMSGRKLYIKGLDCATCANKIEVYVKHMDNVLDASLNFTSGVLYVEVSDISKETQTLTEIIQIVPTLEDDISIELDKASEQKEYSPFSLHESYRLYIGIIFFVLGIIFEKEVYGVWLFVIAYLFAGGGVVYQALRNILKGEVFDENFLMSVATLGAFGVQSYEEGVAVMIFYEIGEMFQSFGVNRSRKSISELMDIRAEYANKVEDNIEVKVSPESVQVNDIIRIKPGERVPLDGLVIEGNSTLDMSALTGESNPKEIGVNEEILAGTLNLNGVICVRVSKVYGESSVSRILELVENASSKKAPMEKFITKFAKIYTPIVVGLALLLVLLPMLVIPDAQLEVYVYRALTFLVVSCPCALVISVPLGLFAGIGAASKKGILIKGGNYLEALQKIDVVAFDKTGTLTKGNFKVVEIVAINGSKDDLLRLGAYGENYSSHPIAQSIKKAYGKDIDDTKIAQYEEVAGNGIHVVIDGEDVILGNAKLMEKHHIGYEKTTSIGSNVHIAKNQVYMGYLVIDDEIKDTSKEAIRLLKAIGIKKCVMLSGDRRVVGEKLARELGLDEVHMQLLPGDKVEQLEHLLHSVSRGRKVAYVGDGINDAPVLARADIGVAMGGIGSDAAIEAADVVLMKDDLVALAQAIQIAKKTMRILWQNITFSLGIKIIILILATFGFANMWMGVFADVGVTLLAILNSMRALKAK
ncbi:MAG: heavy metal translocating P-type ATPase [Longicatena sp.]